MHVLRLCSVFEPPDAALSGRGVRFDPIGGMQNHTACLTRALDARGLSQDVLTSRPPGAPQRDRVAPRSTVHRFGVAIPVARQGWAVAATPAALRLAARCDLVHAHLGEDLAVLPLATAAARLHDVPLVVTVHTSLRHTFAADGLRSRALKAVGGAVESAVSARADHVIALTSRLAQLLIAGGVDAGRTHVIPSGVVPAEFDRALPDPFPGVPRPRVLFAGRLARQKGVGVLAAAAALLRTPAVHVVVVGDGPERPALERSVARSGQAGRVHLTGFLPHHQIPAAMRHADVFVLPSIYEELGSVLLEALQAELPIVASETGGVAEAVGSAAVLVPPGDPAALAAAVDGLLADPAAAERLRRRARARAASFDWEVLAAQVHDVYRLASETTARAPQRAGVLAVAGGDAGGPGTGA